MENTTTKWHKYSKSKKGIAEITYREQIRNSKKKSFFMKKKEQKNRFEMLLHFSV